MADQMTSVLPHEKGGHRYNKMGVCDCGCRMEKSRATTNEQGTNPFGECPKNPMNNQEEPSVAEFSHRTRLKPETWHERFEDMSPKGRLRLKMQGDGDIILEIIQTHNPVTGSELGEPIKAQVEFCTSGGESPDTLGALSDLIHIVAKENKTNPQHRN